jgi:hypothetical protein
MNQNIPLDVIYSANLMPKNQTKRRELPQNDPQYSHPAASRVPYFAHRAATLFLFPLKIRLQETRPYPARTIPTLKTKQLRRRYFVPAMARTAQNRITLRRHTGALSNPSPGPSSTGNRRFAVIMVVAPRAGVPYFALRSRPQAGSAVHERVNAFALAGQVDRQGPPHRRHHQTEFPLSDQGFGTEDERLAAPRSFIVMIFFNALKYFESPAVLARGADLSLTMMYVGVHGPDQGRTGTPYAVPADGHGPHTGPNGTITGDQRRKQRSQDKPHPTVGIAVTCRSRWRSLNARASPQRISSCSRSSPGHPHLRRPAITALLTYPIASGMIGTICVRAPRALVTRSTPTRVHHQVQRRRRQTAKLTGPLGQLG